MKKLLLLFLLVTFTTTAQLPQKWVRGEVSEKFEKDGNTVITIHGKEIGLQKVYSYTFVVVDPCNFYRINQEYDILLSVNSGTYDFAYNFQFGMYSPSQMRKFHNTLKTTK